MKPKSLPYELRIGVTGHCGLDAQRPCVVFPEFADEKDPDDPNEPLPRQTAFRAASRAVIDRSEIVVAVWEGKPSNKPGGTAPTVEYAVATRRLVIWINPDQLQDEPRWLSNRPPARPLQRDGGKFMLPRLWQKQQQEDVVFGPVAGMWSRPLPATARTLSPNFHRLAAYNRDPAFDKRKLQHDPRIGR